MVGEGAVLDAWRRSWCCCAVCPVPDRGHETFGTVWYFASISSGLIRVGLLSVEDCCPLRLVSPLSDPRHDRSLDSGLYSQRGIGFVARNYHHHVEAALASGIGGLGMLFNIFSPGVGPCAKWAAVGG